MLSRHVEFKIPGIHVPELVEANLGRQICTTLFGSILAPTKKRTKIGQEFRVIAAESADSLE